MAKHRYRVVGELSVAGHVKDEEFSAEYEDHEEEALIASGALERVRRSDAPKAPEDAGAKKEEK